MKFTKEYTESLIRLIESQASELETDCDRVKYSTSKRAIEKEIDKLRGDVEYLKEYLKNGGGSK